MLNTKFTEEKKDTVKSLLIFGALGLGSGVAIASNVDCAKTYKVLYSAVLGACGGIMGYAVAKDKYDSMRWSFNKGLRVGEEIMIRAADDYDKYIAANMIKAFDKSINEDKYFDHLNSAIKSENNRGKEA